MDSIKNLDPKRVGVSSVLGFCAGTQVKYLTKEATRAVGMSLIFLQYLSYLGWITIHWRAIVSSIESAADQDGDGKFDLNDLKIMVKKTVNFLGRGIPDAAGFAAGFYGGLKLTW